MVASLLVALLTTKCGHVVCIIFIFYFLLVHWRLQVGAELNGWCVCHCMGLHCVSIEASITPWVKHTPLHPRTMTPFTTHLRTPIPIHHSPSPPTASFHYSPSHHSTTSSLAFTHHSITHPPLTFTLHSITPSLAFTHHTLFRRTRAQVDALPPRALGPPVDFGPVAPQQREPPLRLPGQVAMEAEARYGRELS